MIMILILNLFDIYMRIYHHDLLIIFTQQTQIEEDEEDEEIAVMNHPLKVYQIKLKFLGKLFMMR